MSCPSNKISNLANTLSATNGLSFRAALRRDETHWSLLSFVDSGSFAIKLFSILFDNLTKLSFPLVRFFGSSAMARNPVITSRAEKRFPGLSETGLEWWGRLRIEILP